MAERRLTVKAAALWAGGAVAAFHLAMEFPALAFLIGVFAFCLTQLLKVRSLRAAFRWGIAVGLACYGPQLAFFSNIFGAAAIALWVVLAIWVAIFLLLAKASIDKFGWAGWLLVPVIWTGLEWFRSEGYYLRFSWLTVGWGLSGDWQALSVLGVYGVGFALMLVVVAVQFVQMRRARRLGIIMLTGLAAIYIVWPLTERGWVGSGSSIDVLGIQTENLPDSEIPRLLDTALKRYPKTELIVLSEYAFENAIPDNVLAWCKTNRKYLIAGGEEIFGPGQNDFRDTAFVVDPAGQIVFSQCKSVPIPFFADGQAAKEQRVWESPWGKIGICVCYDLSYRRVMDRLVEQGAQAIIVPAMDAVHWGRHAHELNARVGPIRAAEYSLPVFRVASSGISQLIERGGEIEATAPYPGVGEMVAGQITIRGPGSVPIDHWLAPICTIATGALAAALCIMGIAKKLRQPKNSQQTPSGDKVPSSN